MGLVAAGLMAGTAHAGPQRASTLAVSPATGGRHEPIVVAFTGRRATGVFGRTRRSYHVEAHAVHPASACVNNRDATLPGAPAGRRLHATLDPARGEGGPLGWCRGAFRGTVTYTEDYACPPTGRCVPPKGFERRTRFVARFAFRVR